MLQLAPQSMTRVTPRGMTRAVFLRIVCPAGIRNRAIDEPSRPGVSLPRLAAATSQEPNPAWPSSGYRMQRAQRLLFRISAGSVITLMCAAVALGLFEFIMLQSSGGKDAATVSTATRGTRIAEPGIRFRPGRSTSCAYLDANRRVLECLPEVSRTNEAGSRDVHAFGAYSSAGRRKRRSGSSFTRWNSDRSIPCFAREALAEGSAASYVLDVTAMRRAGMAVVAARPKKQTVPCVR